MVITANEFNSLVTKNKNVININNNENNDSKYYFLFSELKNIPDNCK
jgi:hypothetical protein